VPAVLDLYLALVVLILGRLRGADRPDAELVRRFRGGDARALGTLYDRHARYLLNYVGLFMGDYGPAEDIVQDAFTRLMDAVQGGQEVLNAKAWLTVTCRNLAIDLARRRTRHPTLSVDCDPDGDAPVASLPPEERTPLMDVGQAQFLDALGAALGRLPQEQRETFLSKEVLGFTFREIAEQGGLTESTVKSRLRYALAKLQGELEGWR
jgi:RNA polymerase sigma-70 factor (ECF subfamily)